MSDETLPRTPPPETPPFVVQSSSSGDIAPELPLQETLLPGLGLPTPEPRPPADADPGATMQRAPADTNPTPEPPPIGVTLDVAVVPKSPEEVLAAQATMHKPGDVTATRAPFPQIGEHEIVRELGRGGMGVVYLARHKRLKRLVALKMVLAGAQADAEQMVRFRAEAEAIARLQHPNIVQIYDIGEQDNLPYFSLEFLDGGSLDRRLKKGPLDDPLAARLLEVLARAMAAAHQAGVVHRDLKPANVLLGGGEETPLEQCVLKITDFGLAKKLDEDSGQTRAGTVVGTPSYMPPEQAWGKVDELGPLVDVYSLGAILYELLTGRPPFRAASVWDTLDQVVKLDPVPPRQLQPTVSRDLETICLKCLRKLSAERYASAADLAEDLRRFQAGEPIVARPVGRVERVRKWAKRHPAQAAAWAFGGAALVTFLVSVFWVQQSELRATENEIKFTKIKEGAEASLDSVAAALPLKRRGVLAADAAMTKADQTLALKEDVRLDDVKARANQLRPKVLELRRALPLYDEGIKARDQAQFFNSQTSQRERVDRIKNVRAKAREALAALGPAEDSPEGKLLRDEYLDDAEMEAVRAARAEMLVLLAVNVAQALPGEDEKKQTQEALDLLLQAERLTEKPVLACALVRTAIFRHRNEPEKAAQEKTRAAKMQPSSAVDAFLVGQKAVEDHDWFGAICHFEQSLRIHPTFWASYYVAQCQLKVQHYVEAKASLTHCIDLKPDFIWPYLLRGLANAERSEQAAHDPRLSPEQQRRTADDAFEAASADFRKASELRPDADASYVLFVNRGLLHVRRKQYVEAEKDLREALRLNPKHPAGYLTLALAFQNQGKWDAALKQLDQGVHELDTATDKELRALAPYLYRNRAVIQAERQDIAAALSDREKAIQREESRGLDHLLSTEKLALADDHYQRARLFYQEKQGDEALGECRKATELAPTDVRVLRLKAATLLELKRYPEAVTAFDQYLARGKRTAEDYGTRGLARLGNRDKFGAIADLSMALDLEPEGTPVGRWHAERGWAYLLAGDAPKLALDDFDKTLELNPADADAYAGRGNARVKLGDYEKAVLDAAQAVRRAPEDVRILYTAARIYAQAVARAEDDTKKRDHHELAVRYEVRALDLLDQALDRTKPNERGKFWSESVLRDPAFTPLRRSPRFDQLSRVYPAAPK